jgi:hypothetical protein
MEWKKELDERKRDYAANGVYLPSTYGADIEAEQAFQTELHGIVDEMKLKLVDEKKILEGTLDVEYGKGDWVLPQMENELSISKHTELQWNNDSPSGSSITDLTHVSTHDSNISFSIAENSNPSFRTIVLRRLSTRSPISSCSAKSDDCGTAIDAMNECSECTVPMISEQMLGTPNEARW